MLEKVKLFINILEGHNNLYLKYLLLEKLNKAKVWETQERFT